MSYYNSDKEFYFALYLLKNKINLESILNLELSDIELEKNLNGRKIDFYGLSDDDRQLYMEIQLTKADDIHIEQLAKIINEPQLNNYILIWMALDFNTDKLNKIEEAINISNKNINFYAIKVNEEVLSFLQILNGMFVNVVIDNLSILDEVKNKFTVKEIYYRIQDENNTIPIKKEEEILDLDNKGHVMKVILQKLRSKELTYYPSIFRGKKMDGNVISLGSGCSDTTYYIGINRKHYLYITLRVKNRELFESLLMKQDEINSYFDYFIEWDTKNNQISTYIYYNRDKKELKINQLVRLVNKYVRFFTPYFYKNLLDKNIK